MNKTVYNGNVSDIYDTVSFKFVHVASCGVHMDSKHITVREKGRSDWHLLYVESGEMICQIGKETVTIGAGGFLIYPPRVPQRYEQNGGVCYWVHFSGTAIPEILLDSGLKSRRFLAKGTHSREITRIFERMIYRYATNYKLRDLALSSDLTALLLQIGLSVCDQENAVWDERLCAVILYMHRRYFEQVDVNAYAEMAGLSPGRFSHIFKDAVGMAPHSYLLNLRLSHAADVLLTTDQSVSAIAYSVGFSDPLYFSRLFKKRYNVSPELFRKQTGRVTHGRAMRSSGCD